MTNYIFGYGNTILCQQPLSGEWYNHTKCSESIKYHVINAGVTYAKYEIIVTAKEFCSDCPCNKGEVYIKYNFR